MRIGAATANHNKASISLVVDALGPALTTLRYGIKILVQEHARVRTMTKQQKVYLAN